jgi:GntR family transcriptional regulator
MFIKIDPSSGVPIYLQIIQEMKLNIAGGILAPGDKLPSVRNLAIELRVNPNTVSKAYNELEREGMIFTRRGEGTFISERMQDIKSISQLDMLREKINESVEIARKFDIAREQVHILVDESFDNLIHKGV